MLNKTFLSILYNLRESVFAPKAFEYDLDVEAVNCFIYECIKSGTPALITRFGNVELDVLLNYVSIKKGQKNKVVSVLSRMAGNKPSYWDSSALERFELNAGFFPTEEPFLSKYCEYIISNLCEVDILASWINREIEFTAELEKAKKVNLHSIEPFFSNTKWTHALKNKTVLVIHPFDGLIKKQFFKRDQLFNGLLPDFEIKVLKAVQSSAGSESGFEDWFEALNYMLDEVKTIDFDIAIIGAGAYGMPLAMEIKKLGKVAVHMGGVTQLLFGIKGRRWEADLRYNSLFNKNWVNPTKKYVPKKASEIEGGCYW